MPELINYLLNVDFNDIKKDIEHYDEGKIWDIVYEHLKNQSVLFTIEQSINAARNTKNRFKNRFRNVSPFDETRVILKSSPSGDYINASFVSIPEVFCRKYILTQGPMQETEMDFWLMVWENRCPAIIMLSKVFEKGLPRCHPYFPQNFTESKITYDDISLEVTLESEYREKHFIQRNLVINHTQTGDYHKVIHMQYTRWPDFGVPSSPSNMLNFLWTVRLMGVLDDPLHPSVIHCRAGIGRSGSFVFIDLALKLVEKANSLDGVSLKNLFLDLRKCRMGIVQTSDQLRFCYWAVLQAVDVFLSTSPDERPFIKFKNSIDFLSSVESDVSSDDGINEEQDDVQPDSSSDTEIEVALDGFEYEVDDVDRSNDNELRKRHRQLSSNSSTGLDQGRFKIGQLVNDLDPNFLLFNDMELNLANPTSSPTSSNLPKTNVKLPECTVNNLSDHVNTSSSNALEIMDEADGKFDYNEYLGALLDLRQRKQARSERQRRMRQRVEEMRQRMIEVDLKRDRILPAQVLYRLRRLLTEFGIINSWNGVIVSCVAVFGAISFGSYWIFQRYF